MPTIHEVAQKANVSITTVSHVINKSRFVSEEVQLRVLSSMEELGYRPNAIARSLRRGRTLTIGLILPDSANPFFAEIGRGIETKAFNNGFNAILCNSDGDPQKEALYIDVLLKKQIDGLVLVATGNHPETLETLKKSHIPIVIVDRKIPLPNADIVLVDNRIGGYLATRHLISLGHVRIGCVSGPSNLTPSGDRVLGYKEALVEAGIPIDEGLILTGDFQLASGRSNTLELLNLSHPPSAIFLSNDLMAIGAIRAALENGREVPRDLAIVGFDDIELSSYITPMLTTVRQPTKNIGEEATELLIERINNSTSPTKSLLIPPELIIRDSCGGKS